MKIIIYMEGWKFVLYQFIAMVIGGLFLDYMLKHKGDK